MDWLKFLACLFFGFFGLHKFIEKKPIWGFIYMFTCGLFGIGWIFDCVRYFIAALKNTTPKESSKKALLITPIVCIVLFIGMIISAAFSDTTALNTDVPTSSENIVISSQSVSESDLPIPSKNSSSDSISSESEITSNSSSSETKNSSSNSSISSEAEASSSSSSSSKIESSNSNNSSGSKNSSSSASVIVPEESETGENLVWVPTNGGTKYHSKKSCSNMIDPIQITLESAKARGYTACGRCY